MPKTEDRIEFLQKTGLTIAKIDDGEETKELISTEKFKIGTVREIDFGDMRVTVGILKTSVTKKVPESFKIKAEDLYNLEDLSVEEVTLTSDPAVGKMAEFVVMKSAEGGEKTYSKNIPILKIDNEKQIVGGYALVPDLPDIQGDIVTVKEIEKAAYRFMENLAKTRHRGTGTGLEHKEFQSIGYPVESFVDKKGVYGIKNGWFLQTKVTKQEVWEGIKNGKILGYSIGGIGKRIPVNAEERKNGLLGLLKKVYSLISAPEKPETGMTKSIKTTDKEVKPMPISLELLQKYDVPASQLEALAKEGVDLEKAYEAVENLSKALGMNLSNKGLGHTTLKIASIIRGGGESWPTMIYPGGVAKSGRTETESSENPEKTEAEKPEPESLEKTEDIEHLKAELKKNIERIEALEKARGTRKSVPGEPVETAKNQSQENGWNAQDAIDMSVHESDEIAKSIGVYGKYYQEK